MHGTILALMVAYSASTFQLTGKAKPLKIRGKDLQKYSNIIYIIVHFTKISAFQNEAYSKPLTYKNGICLACGTNKTKVNSMNITSNTNSLDNGTRKLVEGVLPPQWVAEEESSSAWTS